MLTSSSTMRGVTNEHGDFLRQTVEIESLTLQQVAGRFIYAFLYDEEDVVGCCQVSYITNEEGYD